MAVFPSSPSLLKRSAVFAVCVAVRVVFVVLAARVPLAWLPLLGAFALLPGVGFLYIYFTGRNRTGGVFGESAWWDSLRPVHGVLYLAFAALALLRVRTAWVILAADVAIGVAAYLNRYVVKG
jgi:hypothetical protein